MITIGQLKAYSLELLEYSMEFKRMDYHHEKWKTEKNLKELLEILRKMRFDIKGDLEKLKNKGIR